MGWFSDPHRQNDPLMYRIYFEASHYEHIFPFECTLSLRFADRKILQKISFFLSRFQRLSIEDMILTVESILETRVHMRHFIKQTIPKFSFTNFQGFGSFQREKYRQMSENIVSLKALLTKSRKSSIFYPFIFLSSMWELPNYLQRSLPPKY